MAPAPPPALHPDDGSSAAEIAALDARAAFVRVGGRVFAGVALPLLGGWPFLERMLPEQTQLVIDVVIPLFLVAGALSLATYSRRTHVRAERAKLVVAEARARLDELSGLLNVRAFRERLRSEVAEAARSRGAFALVALDLDNFKEVNDRLGHTAGDELLAAIGVAIAAELPEAAAGARLAGDEFVLLLPEASRADASLIAQRVARAIARASVTATPLNAHIGVTASTGIAVYGEDGSDAEALTSAAERAMHRAKSAALETHARRAERHSEDVFFAIGEALGRSLDGDAVLRNLCEAVARSLGLDACVIWIPGSDAAMRSRAFYVADPAMVEEAARLLAQTPITQAEAAEAGLLRNRPSYTDDLAAPGALPERFAGVAPPGMWLISAPLSGTGGALLMAGNHERTAPPQPGLETAIARLAVAALSNSQMYARAQRQAEQLTQLAGLGGLLFQDGPFEERLDAVVRRIIEVTGYDAIILDTADPTDSEPCYRSVYQRDADGNDVPAEQLEPWRQLTPGITRPDIARRLAEASGPILLQDVVAAAGPEYEALLAASGVRAAAIVPITWQHHLKGALYFGAYAENAYDEQDAALMQSIASQLAPSLQVATLHVELEHSYAELKDAHLHALLRLAYAAEARDPYTECHLQRIRALAQAVARRMGIDGEELEALGYGAIVHDLGKLRIPDSILMNPGSLSDDEWEQMKRHPEWGAEIIGTNAFYDVAREVALSHHERWDGSGYPRGLQGEEIPLAARIVSVADVYDALTSARPYKAAWAAERALVELIRMRGKTLCPQSVDVFMELWREGEVTRIDDETLNDSLEMDFRSFYAAAA